MECDKVCYPTIVAAQKQAAQILRNKGVKLNPYKCEYGDHYHLYTVKSGKLKHKKKEKYKFEVREHAEIKPLGRKHFGGSKKKKSDHF